MSIIIRNLIEYSGICEYLPDTIEDYTNFNIDFFADLPTSKPPINLISKITAKPKLINGRLVKSNLSASTKDDKYKYICTIIITYKIEYLGLYDSNVYAQTYDSTLTTFIPTSNCSTYSNNIVPSIYIEDMHCEVLSDDSLMLNTSGLIILESA